MIDKVSAEIDSRKAQKLIAEGIISPDDLIDAIVTLECGTCHFEQAVNNDVCVNCQADIS